MGNMNRRGGGQVCGVRACLKHLAGLAAQAEFIDGAHVGLWNSQGPEPLSLAYRPSEN